MPVPLWLLPLIPVTIRSLLRTQFARVTVGRHLIPSSTLMLLALASSACRHEQPTTEPEPQQAGQPVSVVESAARIAVIQGASMMGDQETVRQQGQAMAESLRRSIRLADPARKVDRESARSLARRVPGVRSVVWLDHENLFATVDSAQARSDQTIDRICIALEPLGDTLGVVVNLQNSAAQNGTELTTLSRNCQLAPGERALLSKALPIDPISPEVRAQHEANQNLSRQTDEQRMRQAESLRVLERNTKPLQR